MQDRQAGGGKHLSGAGQRGPWLEWVASCLGLLLLLGTFGLVGWQALEDPTSPPAITVETVGVTPIPGGYRVTIRAQNMGGAAAAQVRIEGILSQGQGPSETSDVVFNYIPGHSTQVGGLFFAQNPLSGNLSLRASGFAKP